MIVLPLLLALLIMLLAPDSDTGRTLHRFLVEPTARFIRELSLRKLAIGLVVVFICLAIPEFASIMLAFGDAMLFGEILLALSIVAVNVRLRAGLRQLRRLRTLAAIAIRRPARPRRRRPAPARRPRRDADDDRPAVPGYALA